MVKEFLKKNIDELGLEKEKLENESARLNFMKKRLYESIEEIQQNADVDFEVFSPRTEGNSSKEKLNDMYEQINEVKKQFVQISRKLEEVSAKLQNFEIMLSEIEDMEKRLLCK